MPNRITATGLEVATRAELVAYYTTQFQNIYGADINLSSDSPDGQMLNIFVQAILDLEDFTVQVYSTMDPDNAIGVTLDQRVTLNGIQRLQGTNTLTDVTITTSSGLILQGLDNFPDDPYTVADNAGNQWVLVSTQNIVAAGTYTFVFQSKNVGAVLTTPGSITVPVTIVLGVTSINNFSVPISIGLNEETDAALKIRRLKSVSLSSQGFLQGLLAALLNINGLIDAFVYENDTGLTDGDGVPGHSIWVIVSGTPVPPAALAWNVAKTYNYGDLVSSGGFVYKSIVNNNTGNLVTNTAFWNIYSPIAQAIYNKRNAGCGMFGSVSEVLIQVDGSPFVVSWDVVQNENLFVKFTLSSLDGVTPPNLALILSQLPILFVPGVAQKVNINDLATIIQQIDPNALVTLEGFSTSAGGVYTPTLVPTTKQFQFVVVPPNIIGLPIILTSPQAVTSVDNTDTVIVNVVVPTSGTEQFTPIGGFGPFTWAVTAGTGTVSVGGLYTAPGGTETDTLQVTDSLGNTAIATITVI